MALSTHRYLLALFVALTFLGIAVEQACAEEISTGRAAVWLAPPSLAHFVASEQALRRKSVAEANLLGGIDPPGRAYIALVGWLAGAGAVHELSKGGHKTRGRIGLSVLIALQLAGAVWDSHEARRADACRQ